MRGIKPFKLGLITRPFQWDDAHHLGVSVTAYFGFDPPGQLFTDVEMWEVVASELGAEALDVGIPKSRSEYLVVGRCFQPRGTPAPTCPVRAVVGSMDKSLYVVGDRYWVNGVPTEPRPFVEMPLDWAHAFGGEGFEHNPHGKGAAWVSDEQGRPVRPLPNVEAPGHLVKSERDRPAPAGFGPHEFTWPVRFSLAGTYDATWLKTRYPGFAADLDWRIWNQAGPDQQREVPWRGDEPVRLENLHPEKPILETRLPGLRARCFVLKEPAEGVEPDFSEVELRATTVWLFPHLERGVVVFQGATPVREDDAADVDTVMIAAERLAEPRPVEHYRRVLEKRIGLESKENPAVHLQDQDLMPADQVGFSPETKKQMELLQQEGLRAERMRTRSARDIEQARATLIELGLDPDEHGPRPPEPVPEPPKLEELGEVLEQMRTQMEEHKVEAERTKAAELERVAAKYEEMGLDFEEVRHEITSPRTGPPAFTAEKMRADVQRAADEAAAIGHPVDEVEHYATDPDWYTMWQKAERDLIQAYRRFGHFQASAPRMAEQDAARLKAELQRELQSGASLARRDLTGADLAGMDLRGADLSYSFMESTNLEHTDLRDANLEGAVLARADLTGAQLSGARLAGANLGRAKLTAATLTGVDLSSATLFGADLRGADLTGTNLDGAQFIETRLEQSVMTSALLRGAFFFEAKLDRLRFTGAELSNAVFYKVDLAGADFGGATLDGATFLDSTLDGANFVNAHMHGVRTMGEHASWRATDLKGAQLVGANLRKVDLSGADFSGACLDKADLSEANLEKARFYRAVARESLFIKANLRSAFMVSIDLLKSILQKADLRGTDLRGANLYASDFALVRSDGSTNVTDAIQTKVRSVPVRRQP